MAKAKSLPIASPTEVASTKASRDNELRWRAEDALRTCEQYKKNEKDKQLMKAVKQLAKEKMKDLQKVLKK